MFLGNFSPNDWGGVIGSMAAMGEKDQHGCAARSVPAVKERYRSGQTDGNRRILEAPCATTGWLRSHAVRALRLHETGGPDGVKTLQERRRLYGATIKDALTTLWGASDRCAAAALVITPVLRRPLSNMDN
jgi:hypothetical protein